MAAGAWVAGAGGTAVSDRLAEAADLAVVAADLAEASEASAAAAVAVVVAERAGKSVMQNAKCKMQKQRLYR